MYLFFLVTILFCSCSTESNPENDMANEIKILEEKNQELVLQRDAYEELYSEVKGDLDKLKIIMGYWWFTDW